MHQGRRRAGRRVEFGPAQAPFDRGARRPERVEPGAQQRHFGPRRLGLRPPQEGEFCPWRADGVHLGELAPERLSQAGAVAPERAVFDDARPEPNPRDAGHEGEGSADHGRIVAEADRLRHADARPVGRRHQGVFLPARTARRDGRGRVLAQHEGAGLAADAAADTPVLLDRAAAHRLNPVEGEVARGERVGDPSAEPRRLLVVHARVLRQDVAAGRGLRLAAGRQEGARPA